MQKQIRINTKKLREILSINLGGINGYDYSDEFPNCSDRDSLLNFHTILEIIDYGSYQNKRKLEQNYAHLNRNKLILSDFISLKLKKLFEKNPNLFKTKNLKKIDKKRLEEIFTDNTKKIMVNDLEERYNSLSHLIDFIIKKGPLSRIIQDSGGYLVRPNNKGFFQTLSQVKGYNEPFRERLNILAKALEMRDIIKFKDAHNKDVSLNPEILTFLIRIGLFEINQKNLKEKLQSRKMLTSQEEFIIKDLAKKILKKIAKIAKIDPYKLDDILWTQARFYCKFKKPECIDCFFNKVCDSQNKKSKMIFNPPNSSKIKEKILVINTGRCAWGKCVFCGFGKIEKELNSKKLKSKIVSFFNKVDSGDTVAIFNSGSFFDNKQIPKKIRDIIYFLSIKKNIAGLVVESTPNFLKSAELKKIRDLGINLKIAIGLEVLNDRIRKKLNKQFSKKEVIKAIELIRKFGHKVRLYVLANAPFTNKNDLKGTINFSKFYADDLYILNCIPHKNTPLYNLYVLNKWEPWTETQFKSKIKKYISENVYFETNNEVL